jgi:hypothetical protein
VEGYKEGQILIRTDESSFKGEKIQLIQKLPNKDWRFDRLHDDVVWPNFPPANLNPETGETEKRFSAETCIISEEQLREEFTLLSYASIPELEEELHS